MVHLYQSLKSTIKFGYKSKIIEDSLIIQLVKFRLNLQVNITWLFF
jgi:hypothetical protein